MSPEPDNPTEKAGNRHNAADRAKLADIHGHAAAIQAAAVDLGHDPHPETAFMHHGKAGDIPDAAEPHSYESVIKAAGEWELDILANPFGGPNGGKDADGEYFSPNTKFHEDKIPNPPLVHYHGYGDDKRPEGLPDFLGGTLKRWVDAQGVWYRGALDKSNARARAMMDAARKGTLRASTGVVLATHRVNKATGEILSWLNGEISIFDTATGKRPANGYAVAIPALKATFEKAGLTLPELDQPATPETDTQGAASPVAVARGVVPEKAATEKNEMDEALKTEIATAVAVAVKAQKDAEAVEAERVAQENERVAALVKAGVEAERVKWEKSKDGRLGIAPAQMHFADTNKYDNIPTDDLNFMGAVLVAQKASQANLAGPSDGLIKALAIRTAGDKTVFKHKNGTEIPLGDMGRHALKSAFLKAGMDFDPAELLNAQKANELDHTTQSGFGSDWVTVNYSDRLWELIRFKTWVLDRMQTVEVPQGAATDVILVQGADPTWYKVAQTTDNNATTGIPDATVPASKVATANKTLSVAKMGARVLFSGELTEDSLQPWAANLRAQMELSGAEQLENAIINGDTDTTNSTNINAIDTSPAGTEVYLLMNGFRKLPLITTTANSVNVGTLADTSILDVVKTMGAAGKNAADKSKVTIIMDMNVYWKALTLSNLKSIQSFQNSTIENGELTKIWNYEVRNSGFFHANSAKLMANSAGKVDADTDSNNTLGAFLAVRWDQWLFGYKRRMTIETTRYARSDSTEITALARVGMINRDGEASAIGYNVTV